MGILLLTRLFITHLRFRCHHASVLVFAKSGHPTEKVLVVSQMNLITASCGEDPAVLEVARF